MYSENVGLDELLDLLPIAADRGWEIGHTGMIRDASGRCPLYALINEIDRESTRPHYLNPFAAFREIGIVAEYSTIANIMEAADTRHHPLRPQLLEALGL